MWGGIRSRLGIQVEKLSSTLVSLVWVQQSVACRRALPLPKLAAAGARLAGRSSLVQLVVLWVDSWWVLLQLYWLEVLRDLLVMPQAPSLVAANSILTTRRPLALWVLGAVELALV